MEVLTHTKRRDFKNCRRYYFLRHEKHLKLKRERTGRRRGKAFGEALMAVRMDPIASRTIYDEGDAKVITDSLADSYADLEPDSEHEAYELDLEIAVIAVLVRRYLLFYGVDSRREVEYELPLKNPDTKRTSRTFRLGGKIDGVVVSGKHVATLVEDKLTQQIQKVMLDRLELDDQTSEYVDAFLSMGWDAQVDFRHTRYPSIQPKEIGKGEERHRESIDEYVARLDLDILDRPEFYFVRQILSFPLHRMEEFRRMRWQVAKDIIDTRKNGRWYQNPSKCWEYGGCEYLPICTGLDGWSNLYRVAEDNEELEGNSGEAA